MVSGAALAHLWVFDGTQGILLPIVPNASSMESIREGWDPFQAYLDSDTPPPLTDADTVVRENIAWCTVAQAYAEAKRAADLPDAALAQAKESLVALAQHPREQGAGVSDTRFWKAGNVDYKRVPVITGVCLDQYRSKASLEVRITAMS